MSGRFYQVYDVFTETVLAGNPLAVVHDCTGLDGEAMQRIAREFNLSETVFVLPAANPLHAASIRIFTPTFEMPFAGHPTVGAAVALAQRRQSVDGALLVLEEKIGAVRCIVSRGSKAAFAEFDLPQLSTEMPLSATPELIGAALGLGPDDVGFENHRPCAWSAGVPYVMVPVRGLAAAARVRLDRGLWEEIAPSRGPDVRASAYIYCRETVDAQTAFHARMLTGTQSSHEDPATGSALAAFSGAIVQFDRPADGAWSGWIEQGIEMGRHSRLRLEIDVAAGVASAARIGGHAVLAAEGRLYC